MKFEKIALKKSWTTPVLRRVPLTEALLRKIEAHNPEFAAQLRRVPPKMN